MSSYLESRKDIFKYNDQNQLETEKLTCVSSPNKIEFKPNDGIYVNGTKLSGGGGGTGNTAAVDPQGPASGPYTVSGLILGKTVVDFTSSLANDAAFDWIEGQTLTLNFVENPAVPFASMTHIIPIIKTTGYKPTERYAMDIVANYTMDPLRTSLSMVLNFQFINSGNSNLLSGWKLYIDFVYA